MTTVDISTITKNRYNRLINLMESEIMNTNYYYLGSKEDIDPFLLKGIHSYIKFNLYQAMYEQITRMKDERPLTPKDAMNYLFQNKEGRAKLGYTRNQTADQLYEFEMNINNMRTVFYQLAHPYYIQIDEIYPRFTQLLDLIMMRLIEKDKNLLNLLWSKRYTNALLPQLINNEFVKMYLSKDNAIGEHRAFVEKVNQLFLQEHKYYLI